MVTMHARMNYFLICHKMYTPKSSYLFRLVRGCRSIKTDLCLIFALLEDIRIDLLINVLLNSNQPPSGV